jgi:glutamine amidotransferase
MGRLVAYTANRTDGLLSALRFERHAITPSVTGAEGAWGVAFYQGDEVLHKKRPLPSGSAPSWPDLAEGVHSDCALMHVREPTIGDFRTDNTHPFRFRRWSFAHQGTVARFAERRDALVAALPDFLQRNLRGETDSEVFFHLVLHALHRRGTLDLAKAPPESVVAALLESSDELRAQDRQGAIAGPGAHARSGLSAGLTDGRQTCARGQGAPVFYVQRQGPLPADEPAPRRSAPRRAAVLRSVMLTTAESAPMNYQAVPQGHVAVVGRDLHVELHAPVSADA